MAGGISIDAAVNRGGVEVVISGGTTSAATVSGLGAFQNVLAFGFASSTKTESGATQNVSGGMASNTTVDPGGVQNVASNASHNIGVATGVTLTGGFGIAGAATQNVSAGGCLDTIAMSDGFEYVSSGGQAYGTVVSRGAEQIVFSGATAGFTTVSGGGTAIVYGSNSFGTLNSGGNETVYGKDSSVLIYSGGVQYVYGAVVQPTIEFGGTEIIEAGGTLSDGYAAIDGGTLILSAGAIVSRPIVMNGGTLTIGGTATPNVAISGFALGGSIDLAGIAFHSGGSGSCFRTTCCRSPRTATTTICNSIRRRILPATSLSSPWMAAQERWSPLFPPHPTLPLLAKFFRLILANDHRLGRIRWQLCQRRRLYRSLWNCRRHPRHRRRGLSVGFERRLCHRHRCVEPWPGRRS